MEPPSNTMPGLKRRQPHLLVDVAGDVTVFKEIIVFLAPTVKHPAHQYPIVDFPGLTTKVGPSLGTTHPHNQTQRKNTVKVHFFLQNISLPFLVWLGL
jgi:hypothetical protein